MEIRGIRKARVDVARGGDVTIEVLAAPERSEDALRSRIAEVARSVLGSAASVASINVLMATRRAVPGRDHPRRKLSSLITRRTHETFSTQVILSREGDVVTGEAECAAAHHQARSVAQAVVDGLDEVADKPLHLHTVDTVRIGDELLALVGLTFGDRMLLGTAEVKFDLPDAVARATLHAVNRSLAYC